MELALLASRSIGKCVLGKEEIHMNSMSCRVVASLISLTAFFSLLALVMPGQGEAQGRYRGERYTKGEVEQVIDRVERRSDTFASAFDDALDQSRLDDSTREDRLNEQVEQFATALNMLRSEFERRDNWRETRYNVQEVMQQADQINRLMHNTRMADGVEEKWTAVKKDLSTLAGIYDLQVFN
jgi:flagellar motility protein MotE (MotC chaperone)